MVIFCSIRAKFSDRFHSLSMSPSERIHLKGYLIFTYVHTIDNKRLWHLNFYPGDATWHSFAPLFARHVAKLAYSLRFLLLSLLHLHSIPTPSIRLLLKNEKEIKLIYLTSSFPLPSSNSFILLLLFLFLLHSTTPKKHPEKKESERSDKREKSWRSKFLCLIQGKDSHFFSP